MKQFLTEYGFTILCAIVVILLIAIVGPASNLVQNKMEGLIEKFAISVDANLIGTGSSNSNNKNYEEDLTNTAWRFNSENNTSVITEWKNYNGMFHESDFDLVFEGVSNTYTENCVKIRIQEDGHVYVGREEFYLGSETIMWTDANQPGYYDEYTGWISGTWSTHTIHITGGNDVKDKNLIAWLKENATLIKGSLEKNHDNKKMPKKGDVITIDNHDYRVLSINNNKAKVMYQGMETMFTDYVDITYDEFTYERMDEYLNQVWYNTLSTKTKNAIIPQNIKITYFTNSDSSDYDFNIIEGMGLGYYKKIKTESFGERKIYLPDLQDIIDYFGKDVELKDMRTFFYYGFNYTEPFDSAFIRSMNGYDDGYGNMNYSYTRYGEMGIWFGGISQWYAYSNPTFVIDLSKADWQY